CFARSRQEALSHKGRGDICGCPLSTSTRAAGGTPWLGTPSPPPAFPLFAQQALQKLDLLAELVVVVHQLLDLADRVQHGGVISIAEPPADLGQRTRGEQL